MSYCYDNKQVPRRVIYGDNLTMMIGGKPFRDQSPPSPITLVIALYDKHDYRQSAIGQPNSRDSFEELRYRFSRLHVVNCVLNDTHYETQMVAA